MYISCNLFIQILIKLIIIKLVKHSKCKLKLYVYDTNVCHASGINNGNIDV